MKNLKAVSTKLMTTMAGMLFAVALSGAGAASFILTYEPEMPEALRGDAE